MDVDVYVGVHVNITFHVHVHVHVHDHVHDYVSPRLELRAAPPTSRRTLNTPNPLRGFDAFGYY